jgi:hypothetical protein
MLAAKASHDDAVTAGAIISFTAAAESAILRFAAMFHILMVGPTIRCILKQYS